MIQRAIAIFYLALRYYAAFTLMGYGFAKLMGAQFTVLDSVLARPMGDVSGFWLTWYYFGYSAIYSDFVALAQVGGAVQLCFRRTALAGALVLLPVMLNVVLIDIHVVKFSFASGALRNALYVLAALLAIVSFHARDLYRFFWQSADALGLALTRRTWAIALQVAAVTAMLAYTAHEGYWLANVNNRAPTPIDGAWHVTHSTPEGATGVPDWIYFEYNRAFMAVFHLPDGRYRTHDFRADSSLHTLSISNEWLTPGAEIFKGKWSRSGDTLTINGLWHNNQPLQLQLERKPMPVKDHQ